MRRTLQYFSWFLLAATIVACAQLGINADSTTKKIAVGYTLVQTVADDALLLGKAGKLTQKDAKSIADGNDAALLGLKATEEMLKTDPTAAGNRVQQIIVTLTAVQTYLATKKGK